jgi:serine phosphatase RsbU (regulator of sigma subunit)
LRLPLPSVRLLITLIVVVPVAAVSAALIWIAGATSRSVAEQLGHEIVVGATRQVSKHIESYLGAAMRISDTYVRRLQDGYLKPTDLHAWERVMFQDLATNPDVASICFTTPQGDCTWLLRSPRVGQVELELGFVSGSDLDHAREFPAKLSGWVDREHPIRVYTYNATERPWFRTAMEGRGPVWTEIYHWFPNREQTAAVTGTGYTRQVFDKDGNLLGVLIIDVTVAALSRHLRELDLAQTGYAFIVDETNQLVAASDSSVSSGSSRYTLATSPSPAARASAALIASSSTQGSGDDVQTSAGVSKRVFIGDSGEPARAQASFIQHSIPLPGINWRIVTVLPEKSFLGPSQALQHRAILLAIGAIIAGTAVGLILSRNLSRPLLRLTEHVGRVGAGDFDRRLELGHASELRRLSDEVNRMAGGLKHRMQLEHSLAVATQVQQGLLPASIPAPNGVQIAACSKYCDSTGGDYYDFIEIADLAGHSSLVAVGDVTGHGIGAALLMATARGAVRASTPGAPSLGHILSRTNAVLAAQSNHGMFMTLSLVCVDPASRTIRWSSAGHDPCIVYHPDSDSFEDLAGADVPLGIETGISYREFSRPAATPASIIVVGTDGIWEARNAQGEMFGKHRLRELMRNHHRSAEELSAAIKGAMYGWVGDNPLQDDVTFVILKISE